ncbi:MAG: hypothetical protein KDB14_34140, partial [Planctomycetales bacterium]|nr:hypothetical protein [Planctomycetales bacterium]
MKRRHSRTAFLETLEQRIVFDGTLSAIVVDGTLVVSGDAADNGFEIRQVISPGGRATLQSSFVIAPDSTTSVNGLRPGQSYRVNGVDAGLVIDAGAGDDEILVRGIKGKPIAQLSIETGAGDDQVAVGALRVSGAIRLSNEDGVDRRRMSDVDADGALSISGGGAVQLSRVAADSAEIQLEARGGNARSSVRMSDMDLDGRLDVVLVGASMSASRLTAGEATVQLLADKSGIGEGSSLDMSDADLGGDLCIVGGDAGAVHRSRIADQTV